MALPIADLWFGIESVESGLFRIREIHIDPYLAGHMWLVRGRNADLLIDTGTGIRPLRQTVDAIADKPVKAVALNCFYDHAGGLHEFTIRLAHRADVPAIEHPDGRSSVADKFVSDDMLRALPHEGFSASNYQIRPAKVTDPLDDGDIIDLGNRRLEVIHTPGVTAGSICLWESATGNLFTSDFLYTGPEGEKARPRDHDSFVSSLRRLEALPVSKVWPGHFDSLDCSAMKELIDSYL
jgi:glyoxylase-like metal-dependent hydrolase (beta-lactamase superfamily II)